MLDSTMSSCGYAIKALYISYDGAMDPLGPSQILPYILGLSRKGIGFTLLTYEKKDKLAALGAANALKESLKASNIKWEALRYHKSPTVPATAYDILTGIIKGAFIVVKDKIKIIHARSFVGAIPGFLLAKIFRLKFIFDMRGFWADERVDGAIWADKGLLYKMSKWWEKVFLLNADWVVCLTEEAKTLTKEFPYLKDKNIFIDVIPTSADIGRFSVKEKNKELLLRLNLEGRFTFVYFGSVGTWYMLKEMLDFFRATKKIIPESFFMLLTPEPKKNIEDIIKDRLAAGDYYIDYIPYDSLPSWISLADASVFFIKPSYSKKSSCPTKFAESLASGLPVVINAGIGDTDKFVLSYNIGVVIEKFSEEEYIRAANQLFKKILDDKDQLKKNCRKVAESFFSLENSVEKYWKIYQGLTVS